MDKQHHTSLPWGNAAVQHKLSSEPAVWQCTCACGGSADDSARIALFSGWPESCGSAWALAAAPGTCPVHPAQHTHAQSGHWSMVQLLGSSNGSYPVTSNTNSCVIMFSSRWHHRTRENPLTLYLTSQTCSQHYLWKVLVLMPSSNEQNLDN